MAHLGASEKKSSKVLRKVSLRNFFVNFRGGPRPCGWPKVCQRVRSETGKLLAF